MEWIEGACLVGTLSAAESGQGRRFLYVHHKPHTNGNEYHLIFCRLSEITCAIELVEGKDHPKLREIKYGCEEMAVGLLLRLFWCLSLP